MADPFYPIVIAQLSEDEGGGYAGYVPDLPGCMSDGATPEEAAINTRAAMEEWLQECARLGQDRPKVHCASGRARERREALEKIIEKQDSMLKARQTDFDRLSAELDALRNEVAALESPRSSHPWDAVPAYVVKAREPKLPH